MNSLETSQMILSEPAAQNPSKAAVKRPWYVWLCAVAALGIAALYGFLSFTTGGLPRNVASLDGFASLLAIAIVPAALVAAVALVLNPWLGKALLFVVGLLTLALGGIGLLYMLGVMNAGYSSGYAVRLMSGFLVLLLGLYSALLTWLAFATLWRQSERVAWATLIALLVPVVMIASALPRLIGL